MVLRPGQYVMRKLPHITALFWANKILATTLGETAGDYFSQTLRLGTLRSAVLFHAGLTARAVIVALIVALPLAVLAWAGAAVGGRLLGAWRRRN